MNPQWSKRMEKGRNSGERITGIESIKDVLKEIDFISSLSLKKALCLAKLKLLRLLDGLTLPLRMKPHALD